MTVLCLASGVKYASLVGIFLKSECVDCDQTRSEKGCQVATTWSELCLSEPADPESKDRHICMD